MMDYWLLEIKEKILSSPSQQPFSIPPPPPSPSFNLNNKISPSILLIIIILAVIFFISGLLHLLVRFLTRPPNRNPNEIDDFSALQGQLQQLFHLHDSGVDQSFIDTLPVFDYKAIVGVKDPFDCAVCLCEFEFEDKLRLLPKCSHAFHMNCIDTWLLSHSTCPLCRASLVADFPRNSHRSPVVMILESGSQSSRERVVEREGGNSVIGVSSHLGSIYSEDNDDFGLGYEDEMGVKENEISREKVVSIKLGKYRRNGGEDEGIGEIINGEARRCFSMGSFAYVMDDNSSLKVAITKSMKKQSSKKAGHRLAMSECECDSRSELFNGFEAFKILEIGNGGNENCKSIIGSKRDSFSVSKIWLRGKKDEANEARMKSSRRAFSFRFPMNRNPVNSGEPATKNGGVSEIEGQSNSLGCEDEYPSFGRRTLQWLMGRQNKVVHDPSFSTNV